MLAAGAPVEPTGACVPRPGPGWARDGRNLTQLRFPDDGCGRPLDGVRGVLRNPQVHASTRQIPSQPAAAATAATPVPGLLVDVVVLTGDLALFEATRLAVLFWRVMVKGVSYVEQGLAQYEAQVLETKRRALQRLAKQLGRIVLPSLTELQTA